MPRHGQRVKLDFFRAERIGREEGEFSRRILFLPCVANCDMSGHASLRARQTLLSVDTWAVCCCPVGQAFKTKHIDSYWVELSIVRASPACVHYVSVCESCSACRHEADSVQS